MDNKETEEEGINVVKVESSATDDEILVDWRGRACLISSNKHGGITAAAFVLGLQAFEMMAIAAVGNNLITYVFNEMHFPLSKSANIVTNFVGTVFLLSLLGGFLSDSYLGSLRTMFIFGFIELSGFVLLAVQAHLPGLKPPKCSMMAAGVQQQHYCLEAKGYKAGILFLALSLVALGSGCLKPNIISHGADQFRKNDSKRLSSYFNCAYLAFCSGELVALTVLVWVQTQSGMDVGFGVSAAVMAVGMLCLISGTLFYANKRPRGSIFTPIAQVFVAAITKRKQICPSQSEMLNGSQDTVPHNFSGPSPNATTLLLHTQKFRFLDKACVRIQNGGMMMRESPWRLCSVSQVEQVKILISVVPIFACTIIFNTILAQLQTFSVQQGVAMDTRIADNFRIPPASLQSIPYVMLIFVVPLYETCFVPIARKMTGKESGISPLQRVGVGLFVATFSMVSAAVVENKRRNYALKDNKSISIFWVAPQFLIFGVSEMFTAVGLVEFFYKQSVEAGMQSFLTAMTYCSYSFGFYLSSVLVSLVNRITSSSSSSSSSSSGGGGGGWLSDNDLNKDKLDLFYWLLAALSLINFFNYIFWSRWYSYNNNNNPSSLTLISCSANGYGGPQESHHDHGILKHSTVGVNDGR